MNQTRTAKDRRRQLDDRQWLEAMGVDPFWIERPAEPKPTPAAQALVEAASTAESDLRAVLSEPATDWDTLQATIQSCRSCGLCKGRKQAVPGTGDRNATWLMVGEAPGAEEDVAGLPFVGNAGKLLDAMLAALGLNRQTGVYIANAVKCRPPDNRTPAIAEIDACNHFLNQQIAWIQPQIIVALGRPAAYAVLGREASIQSMRGAVQFREQDDRRIPVVVTYHPAYLLRQPEEKWKTWQDLLLAESTLVAPQ
jgi:DNA polymerase